MLGDGFELQQLPNGGVIASNSAGGTLLNQLGFYRLLQTPRLFALTRRA